MLRMTTLMLALAAALLMGCADDTDSDSDPTPDAGPGDAAAPTAFELVVEALNPSCGDCHGGGKTCITTTACFLDDESSMKQAPLNAAACGDTANVAECSLLRIDDGTMPTVGDPPTADERSALVEYIDGL